ncbi:MAG TPA: hypothetical protein H9871_09815 [Candidatus Nesterenkonia stercoripullorum]|uniref:Uncharacterized protein n=1 Tax=Candidatus Nesterenkonia stercoripullorum TaxID=2838701 RepID=A0A9D1UU39_9MICC|nr:hypothetical protein [Candidatus Nesterenkonia stercoripullorum]
MKRQARVSSALPHAVIGGLALSGCAGGPLAPSSSDPPPAPEILTLDDLPHGDPLYAIPWETDDSTVFVRDGVVYAARGSSADKELVALRPEFGDAYGATEQMESIDYEELWSLEVGDAEFAVADHLFEQPRVAVVRDGEALLLDGLSGDHLESFDLPESAVGIAVQTHDSFFIEFDEGEFEQMVMTSTGELLSLHDWVNDFPDDVEDYGALRDWVLPAGEGRRGMLDIRGNEIHWRFDGTDQAFADDLGFGPDYVLIDGKHGYSGALLQYARTELNLATDTYTSDDVAVVRVKDGDVEDIHHGSVLCFEGICSGEFAVADGVVEEGAEVMLSAPDRDDPESTEVPLDDIRSFPVSDSAELPGGEYQAIDLAGSWPHGQGRAPLYLTHDDTDPLGSGENAVVPCQRIDGAAGAIACTATGEPVDDELVPISFVGIPSGHDTQPESYMLSASVTDRHILLAQIMILE